MPLTFFQPARAPRPALIGLALASIALIAPGRTVDAQSPPPQPAQAAQPAALTLGLDAGLVYNFIKPDKTASRW